MQKPRKIFMFLLVIAAAGSFAYIYKYKDMFKSGVDLIEMDARGYDGSNPLVILDTQLITKHFNIHTDLDFDRLDYYEKFFEGFYEYFDREVFTIRQPERLEVYLFNDIKYYKPYARHLTGPGFTEYGFYIAGENLMVVNGETGLGVVAHELAHHFTYCGFDEYPASWIREAISTFFEKFIAHLDENGKLHMTVGYFSDWRLPTTKEVDRFELMTLFTPGYTWQPHIRSFVLFLHKQGKFIEFARAASNSGDDYYGLAALGEVYGRPFDEIAEEVGHEWKKWVHDLPMNNDTFLVEESFVKTSQEWAKWWSENQHRLYFCEDQQIYRVKDEYIKEYHPPEKKEGVLNRS